MAAATHSTLSLRDPSLFREQAFVGGHWLDAAGGEVKQVVNPANGELIGTVPNCGAKEARAAIEAADKALPGWRQRTAKERAQVLRKWFDLIMANQEDLALTLKTNFMLSFNVYFSYLQIPSSIRSHFSAMVKLPAANRKVGG